MWFVNKFDFDIFDYLARYIGTCKKKWNHWHMKNVRNINDKIMVDDNIVCMYFYLSFNLSFNEFESFGDIGSSDSLVFNFDNGCGWCTEVDTIGFGQFESAFDMVVSRFNICFDRIFSLKRFRARFSKCFNRLDS